MKDDEKLKEAGAETSEETTEENKTMDRWTFLKAVGVGIGAVGLDLVTGSHLAARTAAELDGRRGAVQQLVRGLLENPSKVKDFLNTPQAVAEEFGVHLTDADAKTIRETFMQLAEETGSGIRRKPGYIDDVHLDGQWHDNYNKTVEGRGGTKKPPVQKQPGGVKSK